MIIVTAAFMVIGGSLLTIAWYVVYVAWLHDCLRARRARIGEE